MPEIDRRQAAAYAVLAVVVLVLGVRYLRAQGRAAGAPAAMATTARPGPGVALEREAGAASLVHVAGAVRHPGVYRLAAGQRVKDAVARAGGATSRGDPNAINLAAKVADGQQVLVPWRAPVGAAAAAGAVAAGGAAAPGGPIAAPVNLNTATAEQLDTLDGVGPATAAKILQWRQAHGGFRSVDDLAQVPGIGPKKLAALKPKVQV
ncbi:MAG: helix-hairpin-helix domain-containing protein [Solirubrobacteraceae bacterium]